jgi:SP family facilitated glucose transporter-like MFS transporter 8
MSSANLSSVVVGNALGWSSPVFSKFSKPGTESPLSVEPTAEELSWIGSLVALGALVGKF